MRERRISKEKKNGRKKERENKRVNDRTVKEMKKKNNSRGGNYEQTNEINVKNI